ISQMTSHATLRTRLAMHYELIKRGGLIFAAVLVCLAIALICSKYIYIQTIFFLHRNSKIKHEICSVCCEHLKCS
uniref:Uncharacterized protein n=1 Tax=Denticeps clupeoides TaxID=299321 RepID=A0AAY4AQX6_9TELE